MNARRPRVTLRTDVAISTGRSTLALTPSPCWQSGTPVAAAAPAFNGCSSVRFLGGHSSPGDRLVEVTQPPPGPADDYCGRRLDGEGERWFNAGEAASKGVLT